MTRRSTWRSPATSSSSRRSSARTSPTGTVGYIRLAGFSDTAAADVTKALQAHIDAGRTKLILDLRGNPGGFVTAARSVASDFISDGAVFWEQDANGSAEGNAGRARRRRDRDGI